MADYDHMGTGPTIQAAVDSAVKSIDPGGADVIIHAQLVHLTWKSGAGIAGGAPSYTAYVKRTGAIPES